MLNHLFKIIIIVCLFIFSPVFAIAGSQQTSGTTTGPVIIDVRAYLNEATEKFWLDSELLQWLNDGMIEIATRSLCLEALEVDILVAGTSTYSVTGNYIAVQRVLYEDSDGFKGLLRGNLQSIGNIADPGEPVYWYDWGDSVGIYPTPDSSVSGNTIYIYFNTRPSIITSGGTITTPAIYDHALVLYIVARAYMKDKRFGMSAYFMGEFVGLIEAYRVNFSARPKESKDVIK